MTEPNASGRGEGTRLATWTIEAMADDAAQADIPVSDPADERRRARVRYAVARLRAARGEAPA